MKPVPGGRAVRRSHDRSVRPRLAHVTDEACSALRRSRARVVKSQSGMLAGVTASEYVTAPSYRFRPKRYFCQERLSPTGTVAGPGQRLDVRGAARSSLGRRLPRRSDSQHLRLFAGELLIREHALFVKLTKLLQPLCGLGSHSTRRRWGGVGGLSLGGALSCCSAASLLSLCFLAAMAAPPSAAARRLRWRLSRPMVASFDSILVEHLTGSPLLQDPVDPRLLAERKYTS